MATNKQARARERKRYEALQAKQSARRSRRERQLRLTAWIGLAVLVLGSGLTVLLLALNARRTADPEPETPALSLPAPALAEGRSWDATVTTNVGDITLTLDGAAAPQAVASFVYLARQGFFDQVSCHRLTTAGIFVLQCGDPNGDGTGGPGYNFGPIENAPADDFYPAGTLAMARVGGDGSSMGSQFFIVYADSTIGSDAAGGYTVFGSVTGGLDIVESVATQGTATGGTDGAPAQPVVIEAVTVQ